MIGKRVGRYLIVEEIGDGGHAFVFKGVAGDEAVAIKMLKPSAAAEENLERRFKIEAEALKTLRHPNIVGFKDYIFQNGYHYLALEFMDAGAADHILRMNGPIEARYAVPIFNHVLRGVAHAHSFGYLHRDVKPNNILLNKKGEAKLTDFGIAKLLGGEALTQKGFVLGTTAYMAPEYLTMGKDSEQLDIYALGVTFYEMLTARRPFEQERDDEPLAVFAQRVVKGTPVPPSRHRPIPPALERIIMKAIEQDPRKRYKSAEKFRQDLAAEFPDQIAKPILIHHGRVQTNPVEMGEAAGKGAKPAGKGAAAAAVARAPLFADRRVAGASGALCAGVIIGAGLGATGSLPWSAAAACGALVGLGGASAAWFLLRSPQPAVPARAAAAAAAAGAPAPAAAPPSPKKPATAAPAAPPKASEDSVPFYGEFHNNQPAEMTELSELQAFLVVTSGTDEGKRFGLRPVSRIGRDLRFDIRPRDPEMSRQHAAVTFDGANFFVKDLGSANGTYVNDVRTTGDQQLKDGDILRLGRTSMRFEHRRRPKDK